MYLKFTNLDKNSLKKIFQQFDTTIIFTKVDGTERVLRGTLNPELLPVNDDWDGISDTRQNDEVLAVWDLDKQAWRSFRMDSIKDIHVSFSKFLARRLPLNNG